MVNSLELSDYWGMLINNNPMFCYEINVLCDKDKDKGLYVLKELLNIVIKTPQIDINRDGFFNVLENISLFDNIEALERVFALLGRRNEFELNELQSIAGRIAQTFSLDLASTLIANQLLEPKNDLFLMLLLHEFELRGERLIAGKISGVEDFVRKSVQSPNPDLKDLSLIALDDWYCFNPEERYKDRGYNLRNYGFFGTSYCVFNIDRLRTVETTNSSDVIYLEEVCDRSLSSVVGLIKEHVKSVKGGYLFNVKRFSASVEINDNNACQLVSGNKEKLFVGDIKIPKDFRLQKGNYENFYDILFTFFAYGSYAAQGVGEIKGRNLANKLERELILPQNANVYFIDTKGVTGLEQECMDFLIIAQNPDTKDIYSITLSS